MSVLTYKCPNCDGGLVFDPKKQLFACEYCLSEFTEEELRALQPASQEEQENTQEDFEEAAHSVSSEETSSSVQEKAKEALVYTCPSCGAEVATDETTAATFCYYCHNPIVLSGKLSGDQLPSHVVPFKITKEDAKDRFHSWIGKKKYIPADFYSKKQIEKLSGIYYPYWAYDCTISGNLNASARDVRIWRAGDLEYTETKTYALKRAGRIEFKDILRNALKKSQSKMMEGILPFDMSEARDFHLGFLSGFQAEVKDLEKTEFEAEVKKEVDGYVRNILSDTTSSHSNVTIDSVHAQTLKGQWRYVLLPVWILTYRSGQEMYYFALNGQTGQICGRLPLNTKKLALHCFALFAIITAVITLIGGLLLW